MAKPTKTTGRKKHKATYRKGTTNIITCRRANISQPDVHGEYADGKYKVIAEFDAAGLAKFKKELVDFIKDVYPDADPKNIFTQLKNRPIKKDSEETYVGALFKSDNKPLVADAKKNKVPSNVNIGPGSKGRIAYTFADYPASKFTDNKPGVSFYFDAFQVTELVEGGDALSRFGEEDGFTHEPSDADRFDSDNNKADDEDGDEGDALSL